MGNEIYFAIIWVIPIVLSLFGIFEVFKSELGLFAKITIITCFLAFSCLGTIAVVSNIKDLVK